MASNAPAIMMQAAYTTETLREPRVNVVNANDANLRKLKFPESQKTFNIQVKIIFPPYTFTFANVVSFSSSSLLSQHPANSVSNCLDGGVVMSTKRVNNVRSEHAGKRSCCSQFFEIPYKKFYDAI